MSHEISGLDLATDPDKTIVVTVTQSPFSVLSWAPVWEAIQRDQQRPDVQEAARIIAEVAMARMEGVLEDEVMMAGWIAGMEDLRLRAKDWADGFLNNPSRQHQHRRHRPPWSQDA